MECRTPDLQPRRPGEMSGLRTQTDLRVFAAIKLAVHSSLAVARALHSFVCFAVAEFVYTLSEPYRPKRLSVAIFCRGAVLVLAPPAPKLGEPADGVPYA